MPVLYIMTLKSLYRTHFQRRRHLAAKAQPKSGSKGRITEIGGLSDCKPGSGVVRLQDLEFQVSAVPQGRYAHTAYTILRPHGMSGGCGALRVVRCPST